jgi:predicted flap endonuclease-1-like 5' DNA nuclease
MIKRQLKEGESMGTFLEIILLITLITLIGLILGYIVGVVNCKKNNTSRIIQKGKLCEEKASLTEDQNDLLEQESKELIEISKKEKTQTKQTQIVKQQEKPKEEVKQNSTPSKRKIYTTEEIKKQINSLERALNNQADPLNKIRGIGPVIEKKLNTLGIFHFEQIAAWSDKEIQLIDQHLDLKGKIKREEWIKQAKKLALQK